MQDRNKTVIAVQSGNERQHDLGNVFRVCVTLSPSLYFIQRQRLVLGTEGFFFFWDRHCTRWLPISPKMTIADSVCFTSPQLSHSWQQLAEKMNEEKSQWWISFKSLKYGRFQFLNKSYESRDPLVPVNQVFRPLVCCSRTLVMSFCGLHCTLCSSDSRETVSWETVATSPLWLFCCGKAVKQHQKSHSSIQMSHYSSRTLSDSLPFSSPWSW